jgi:dolichol-phosphate mannosyltransferase
MSFEELWSTPGQHVGMSATPEAELSDVVAQATVPARAVTSRRRYDVLRESDAQPRHSRLPAGWLTRLARYVVVGGFAALVNLACFSALYYHLTISGLPAGTTNPVTRTLRYLLVFAIAAEVSTMTNFLINDRVTFSRLSGHARRWFTRCARFHVTSLLGTLITLGISYSLVLAGLGATVAEAVAIAVAFLFNFAFHHIYTYSHPHFAAPAATLAGLRPPADDLTRDSEAATSLPGERPTPALRLSIVMPAQNEEGAVTQTIVALRATLTRARIPFEILVVNDHSADRTEEILTLLSSEFPDVRYVNNDRPKGFGRAIQTGLEHYSGDAVCIVMADASDDPNDVVKYYRKLQEGNECVFGSRFMRGSRVIDYPGHKLLINRLANAFVKAIFRLPLNDTTNAFKAYRREVIQGVSPIISPHFNITVELPLKAITRGYSYAIVPINWYNRKTGVSKLKIREMGSRYLYIVLSIWLERQLVQGDYRRVSAPVAIRDVTYDASPYQALPEEDAQQSTEVRVTVPPADSRRVFSPIQLLVYAVPAALLAIVARTILLRTPSVPFWDEWRTVDLILHYKQGALTFQDFWQFHNEHRIVIPRIIDLGLILFTHWNRQLEMLFDLGVAVAEAALLLASARRVLRSNALVGALIVPGSLLLFSLSQYQNWLWAFQITFIATVFGVACCVFGFARQPARWGFFLLALVGACVAALSSVGGTMAFVAFLPAALRAGRAKCALWIVTACAILIPYFQGFPHSVPISFSRDLVIFALGYLGAPVGYPHPPATIAFGIGGCVLAVVNLAIYWTRERTFKMLDAWIGLGLFAVAVDGITALGRTSYYTGPYAGLSNLMIWGTRYQEFAALWWIALLVVTAVNIRATWHMFRVRLTGLRMGRGIGGKVAFPIGLINVLAVLGLTGALVLVNLAAYSPMKYYQYPQFLLQSCVVSYAVAPDDCLNGFVWDPNYLRIQAAVLAEYKMGPFYDALGSTRPLVRYLAPHGGHIVATILIDPSTGYRVESWLGMLYDSHQPGTHLLYECEVRSSGSEFVSTDAACGGEVLKGSDGWLYSTPPRSGAPTVVALYSCERAGDYFASTDPQCEGQKTLQLLGYAVALVYGYRG